jgi:hypothetical protein
MSRSERRDLATIVGVAVVLAGILWLVNVMHVSVTP